MRQKSGKTRRSPSAVKMSRDHNHSNNHHNNHSNNSSDAELLPDARIRCGAGRIVVGDRTFVSASAALSAYLTQFDGKHHGAGVPSPGGSGRVSQRPARGGVNTSLDAFIAKSRVNGVVSARGSPSAHPANVTGLLTADPNPAEVLGGRNASSSSTSSPYASRLLNGNGSHGSKLSVSFSLPEDSLEEECRSRTSGLSASFAGPGASSTMKSSQQNFSSSLVTPQDSLMADSYYYSGGGGGGGVGGGGYTPSHSTGLSRFDTLASSTASAGRDIHAGGDSLASFNGSASMSALPDSNRLSGFSDHPRSTAVSQNGVGRVAPGGGPRSEVEVLLTAMPSQRELEAVAQDTLREVKLARLLKEAAASGRSPHPGLHNSHPHPHHPPSSSSNLLHSVGNGNSHQSRTHAKPSAAAPVTNIPLHSAANPHTSQTHVKASVLQQSNALPSTAGVGSNAQPSVAVRHSSGADPQQHSAQQASAGNSQASAAGSGQQSGAGNSGNKSVLQQEVEQALSRSAQLLETIKTDSLVSPRCVSDAGSLNTDVLLAVDPYNAAQAANIVAGAAGRQARSRHRYSYHTPAHHARSLSVGQAPISTSTPTKDAPRSLRASGRRRSVDSLGPASFLDLTHSASLLSADSDDILQRLKDSNLRATAEGGGGVDVAGAPSWIEELIPASPQRKPAGDISSAGYLQDSLFSSRGGSGGRHAPSWVDGIDQSDVVSSVDASRDLAESLAVVAGVRRQQQSSGVRAAQESSLTDLSYAGPGLNYSDLFATPDKSKVSFSDSHHHHHPPRSRPKKGVSRNNSFSGVGSGGPAAGHGQRRELAERGGFKPPPVTISRFHQDLAGVDMSRPTSHHHNPLNPHHHLLNSSLGPAHSNGDAASILRKKVCEDSALAQRSMDHYLSDVSGRVGGGGGGGGRGRMPRSSSVDSFKGTGAVGSDVTGASPISRASNLSSKLCLDDPTLTPARHSRGLTFPPPGGRADLSPEADHDLLELEGDRPWERLLPSFKDPVQVGHSNSADAHNALTRPETPTLSGGQQPGSMEALKQMLFRLQSEETSSALPSALLAQQGDGEDLIPALKDYDFEVEPGGQSLERALVHLGRLKTLVQTGTNPSEASSQHLDQAA